MKYKLDDPMTFPACYSMDLYCDHHNDDHEWAEFPHCYTGATFGGCAKQARKAGWVLHAGRTATCPKCSGK